MGLIADTASITVDAALLRSIVQGGPAVTVVTEAGVVPSMAKILTDMAVGVIRGAWVTATAYALGDVVTNASLVYRCLVAHTSAALFATDLAANKWVVHYTAGQVVGVKVQTPSGTAATASLNMPPGVAPTTPVDGDEWATAAGKFVRVAGATVGPLISLASVPASALPAYYGKPVSATTLAITGAGAATLNRIHHVSGTAGNYDITISGLSPAVGDVVGFRVADFAAANKAFRLDAGGTVKIAGRTRYLTLVHTNVVLLQWDGTDWQPLVLNLDSPWVDAGAITVTAVTTNPTKGTISVDRVLWRRSGGTIYLRYEERLTSAGAAGSGDYLFALPVGTFGPLVDVSTAAFTDPLYRIQRPPAGKYVPGAGLGEVSVVPYNTTTFRLNLRTMGSAAANFVSSVTGQFSNALTIFSFEAVFPMTDW